MAFTTDDFNKIWASTSPLTPYDFSENNYKEGWNFIGSTPPARQMWDFLQKQNDEKMQWLYNNKLSLSGGTMTGEIVGNPLTLTADDGNDSTDLVLNPSGSATWNGKEVERVNSSGTDYIRYDSGLQICWGATNGITSSGVTVTFPAPFKDTSYVVFVFAGGYNVNANGVGFTSKTTTSVLLNRSSETSAIANYLIVGKWK